MWASALTEDKNKKPLIPTFGTKGIPSAVPPAFAGNRRSLKAQTRSQLVTESPGAPYYHPYVIANQCAHWCGNPVDFIQAAAHGRKPGIAHTQITPSCAL